MENQGHSGTQENARQLKVFFDVRAFPQSLESNEQTLDALLAQYLERSQHATLSIVNAPHHADLVLEINDRQFSIIHNSTLLERNFISLPLTASNLANIFRIYQQSSRTPYEEENEAEKELQHESLKVQHLNNKVLKSFRHLPHFQAEKTLDHFDQFNEIQEIFYSIDSISSLPRHLAQLKKFRDYETYQLIIHEKGHSSADNISLGVEDEIHRDSISVKNFNALYSLVKKSKSKLFDQTHILKQELGVLGTFLAKEFELKHHSILLIVSRNDFLPPTDEEIEYFNDVFKYLGPVFEYLLLREQLTKKSQMINFALQNFSFPLAIFTAKNHLLFKNQHFTTEMCSEFSQGPNKFTQHQLTSGHKLVFQRSELENMASDIFHYHRISLLGELLNTLQHELSNPLFGLKLTADLLLADDLPQDGLDILKDISSNTLRCQTIIRNFSDLYREESQCSVVVLKNLIQEAVTLTKSESREIRKTIEFHEPLGPETCIRINPTWITQVLFNLIINSAQAIKSRGDITLEDFIKVSVEHNSDEGMVEIHVIDSGPGIPQELHSTLFRPFFTTKSQGTGLGLSICQNLVQREGGRLLLNSRENSDITGAWFTLKLPDENLV